MSSDVSPPLHDSLSIVNSEDIYHNDEWWKSVVRYQLNQNDDYEEVAVYLWHDDDGWTRKNKYVIKTIDAWETDKAIIERLFTETSSEVSSAQFPVSDYYELDGGETVFESDDWWKAILRISEKGSYETQEVMVYLWQEKDGQWRRRQKFTLKNQDKWNEQKEIVESLVDCKASSKTSSGTKSTEQTTATSKTRQNTTSSELEKLEQEMENHLSETLK